MMPSTSKSDRLQKRKKISDSSMQGQVDNISKMISAAEQVTKPSTSKSSRRKSKKSKFVPKPKRVKQPTVNWLDLPSDVMANILSRIGLFDILENAQKVCTTWHQICKEPAMWRAISMDSFYYHVSVSTNRQWSVLRKICMQLVDRSQGQMVDISIKYFCNKGLLRYIADRSSQLRRLEITSCRWDLKGAWSNSFKKLSLLEELSLCVTYISGKDIEAAGRFCPLLKTLKVNQRPCDKPDAELAVAIGKNLPELRHLELVYDEMRNDGLRAILDGCRHLESLDVRECYWIDLKGDLGKRCSEQIKHLKLSRCSVKGCPDSDEEFSSDSDYDDSTSSDSIDSLDFNFDDLNEKTAFVAMLE